MACTNMSAQSLGQECDWKSGRCGWRCC